MEDIKCRKEGCNNSKELLLHHLIPKFMGGTDKDGRKYLCEKHHNILHQIIPSIIWKFVSLEKKAKCKEVIKNFTLKWMKYK